jgi:hypothetical protein
LRREYFSYSASWSAVRSGRHVMSSGADSRGGLPDKETNY